MQKINSNAIRTIIGVILLIYISSAVILVPAGAKLAERAALTEKNLTQLNNIIP